MVQRPEGYPQHQLHDRPHPHSLGSEEHPGTRIRQDIYDNDFHVLVPGPAITSMSCEYALAGSEAVIYGDYFVDDPNVPLTLSVAGVNVDRKDIKISKTQLSFKVPEAGEGPVCVSTIYGEAESIFNYKDSRGIITDFDGTTDLVPQGWNIAASYETDGGIDGQYVVLGPADLDVEGGWQEALKLPFWCGNWNGDPMSITSGPGIPICNFIDFSDFKNIQVRTQHPGKQSLEIRFYADRLYKRSKVCK